MSVRQSPFIQDAASGQRVTRWWLGLIVFFVIFAISVFGIGFALSAIWPTPEGSAIGQVQEAITSVVPILLVFAWVVWHDKRRVASLGFRDPARGVPKLVLGIVIGLAMISVPILLLWATGVYQTSTPPAGASSGFSALPLVLALALTVVLQGSNEEILTRGLLFQSFGLTLPGWLAILLPAVLFALVHGITDPLTFLTIFGYGLFAGFVALNQKSLWLICGIHAGWNWALGNVYGLAVSGIHPKSNALFYLEGAPGAPDWLTGGANGTEGSLIAAFMIITATVLVFLAWRRGDRTTTGAPASQTSTTGPLAAN